MTLFSNRKNPLPANLVYDRLPEKLRKQIGKIWSRTLSQLYDAECEGAFGYRMVRDFVVEERALDLYLTEDQDPMRDCWGCLLTERDVDLVLDVVEVSMQVARRYDGHIFGLDMEQELKTLNERFRQNGVGYRFDPHLNMLMRIDDDLTYTEVVAPAMSLLSDPLYSAANGEFSKAHQDYRNGDWGDCLTKCCAAFESVLKIVIHQKSGVHPNKPAGPLIADVMKLLSLPEGVEPTFVQLANLRNNFSSAHGGGITPRDPDAKLARYALSTTAAAICFVTDAAK